MAEILQNFSSGVLSADPGSGGVTLNSGNLAFLPAIVAPQTMRLALDPEGLAGAPEIVIVTAHTAFATSCTVTRGQETSYGAGAARAHAIDTVWRHVLTRASIIELTVPAATVVATVAATPDPGYVFIDGSTLTNGQTLYPATWARIPASWQSAPNIVLPDWRGRTLFADDTGAVFTLGGVGGANSHAITQAELPAVALSIDPPSTVVSIDPPSTAVTGNTGTESASHAHSADNLSSVFQISTGPGSTVGGAGGIGSAATVTLTNTENTPHTHPAGTLAVDIAPFNATVDIAPFNSPNLGSGTAMSLLPSHGVVNFALKVH